MKSLRLFFTLITLIACVVATEASTITLKFTSGRKVARIAVTTSDEKLTIKGATGTYKNVEWVDYQLTSSEVKLTGNITKLVCNNTGVTEINAQGANQMTQLIANDNRQLAKVNVTGCTELQKMYLNGCALTDIDISSCEKLATFFCYENKLKTLDVSKNTKMYWLDCGTNLLSEINVSNCPLLQVLYCSKNQISALDFSKCPKMIEVLCAENKIKGEQMDKMIQSLPQREKTDEAVVYIIEKSSKTEGNVCTKTQVAKLVAKKWQVIALKADDSFPYEGSDDADGIETIQTDNNATPTQYYNVNGTQLQQPTKGMNIIRMSDGRIVKRMMR